VSLRESFPIFSRLINGKPFVYLDSAATTFKPQCVIDSIVDYYSATTANIHRGKHYFSEAASSLYESSTHTIASYFGAFPDEILFTSGATESFNLLANALPSSVTRFAIPSYEHNSLIAPFLTQKEVFLFPSDVEDDISLETLDLILSTFKPNCVAFSHASHLSGHIQNVKRICQHLHSKGVLSLVDASQSAAHVRIDVKDIGCDFLVASSHKMYGPTGLGILYAKPDLFNSLAQVRSGGGGISSIDNGVIRFKRSPYNLSSGTPHIAGVLGLASAIEFIQSTYKYSQPILKALTSSLHSVNLGPSVQVVKSKSVSNSLPIISILPVDKLFDVDQISQMASDQCNIMMRSGYHCAHQYFAKPGGSAGSLRLSAAAYNDESDILSAFDFLANSWL